MAEFRQIFFFVEGPDDARFFKSVIQPHLINHFDDIRVVEYQRMSKTQKLYRFIRSVKSIPFANYYFIKDINSAPCISEKKRDTYKNYNNRIESEKIIIVVREIESWYVAGLDERACNDFGIRHAPNTDTLTKEQFNLLIPETYGSRTDFMIEVLKSFSIETAKTKNRSFQYFCSKLAI